MLVFASPQEVQTVSCSMHILLTRTLARFGVFGFDVLICVFGVSYVTGGFRWGKSSSLNGIV